MFAPLMKSNHGKIGAQKMMNKTRKFEQIF